MPRNRAHTLTLLSLSSLLLPFSSPHAAMNASNTLIFQINGTERARITANGISTTNISVSTINGMDIDSGGSGSSSMASGWPDAIYCSGSQGGTWMYHTYNYASGGMHDYFPTTGSTYRMQFTSTGAFSMSAGSGYIESCLNKTITQLYTAGQAFNFTGGGIGGGTPTGAIMAFDLATCPSGWSEYTPARGRFLRGIDNGAGNDPSGTRVAGNVQADAFQGHWHDFWSQQNSTAGSTTGGYLTDYTNQSKNNYNKARDAASDGTNGTPRTANETRPKNVAVLYCRKN